MVLPRCDGCESCTIKKAEYQRIDAFKLWYWRRLLRVPWTTRRSNPSTRKEISPEYSLEGLMLKLQYFGHLRQRTDSLKDSELGKDWKQEEKGTAEDEMVGWHHWRNGHEFEQGPGVGDGQGSLVCCSPWGQKESDTTEWLNWTEPFCYWYDNKRPGPASRLIVICLFLSTSTFKSQLYEKKKKKY